MLLHTPDRHGLRGAAARVLELAAVAVYLGTTWVAAASPSTIPIAAIAPFAALCALIPRIVWAAALALGTLVWLLAGDTITANWLPATEQDRALALVASGAIVAVASLVARVTRRSR
jgi:hypothetical protein